MQSTPKACVSWHLKTLNKRLNYSSLFGWNRYNIQLAELSLGSQVALWMKINTDNNIYVFSSNKLVKFSEQKVHLVDPHTETDK